MWRAIIYFLSIALALITELAEWLHISYVKVFAPLASRYNVVNCKIGFLSTFRAAPFKESTKLTPLLVCNSVLVDLFSYH